MRRMVDIGGLALLLVVLARPAHAYVDPGSGALLLQALVAGLTGALFLLRQKLRQAAGWLFSGGRGKGKPGAGPGSDPND